MFKNAVALQATHSVKTVLFDKTGTITEGRPKVCDVYTVKGFPKERLVSLAASLEKNSEHPLAQAITVYADEQKIIPPAAESFRAVTGFGVEGTVAGEKVKIGNAAYLDMPLPAELEAMAEEGKTPMLLSVNGEFAGALTVADVIKESSIEAIAEIRRMGLVTIMLTGDNEKTAQAIAKQAGISRVRAGVLPDGKVAAVEEARASGEKVAMVGDGINDAPALAAADVGIAVGSGTDVAIESADVVLVKNDLRDVAVALRLSRAVMRNIKENLFWAFCYNVLGIPVAAGLLYAFGGPLLNPMLAAAAMSLSSVCVVGNALRLNRFKVKK